MLQGANTFLYIKSYEGKGLAHFGGHFFGVGKGHCAPPQKALYIVRKKSSANFGPLSFMQFQILHSDLFSRHHLTFIVLFFSFKTFWFSENR